MKQLLSLFFIAFISIAASAANLFDELEFYADSELFRRRVGLETELAGLSVDDIVAILMSNSHGWAEAKTVDYLYPDPNNPGHEINAPTRQVIIHDSTIENILVKPEDNAATLEELAAQKGIPGIAEIVNDPLYPEDVEHLQKSLDDLKAAGGLGTTAERAVALQVNTELGNGVRENIYTEDVVNYLRNATTAINRIAIEEKLQVPEIRKRYVGAPMPGFQKQFMSSDYRPTWKRLYYDSMYRSCLEAIGDKQAWTYSDAEASQRLKDFVENLERQGKKGFEPLLPALKWNFVRYSSLMMYMMPDEWLTKYLKTTNWFRARPLLEWREPNNDFNAKATVRWILSLMAATEIHGPITADKLMALRHEAHRLADLDKIQLNKSPEMQNYEWRHNKAIIITPEQRDRIQKGGEQRAKALYALLDDVFSGGKKYREAGLTDEIVARILRDTGIRKEDVKVGQHSFIYGPDVLMGKNGKLYLAEDNSTLVTGIDIVDWISKNFLNEVPELKELVERPQKNYFWEKAVENFRSRANGKKVVIARYAIPDWVKKHSNLLANYDRHWQVVAERLAPMGVEVVEFSLMNKLGLTQAKLPDDVGFVWSALLNKDLRKLQKPGVEFSHTPGVEFFDTKLLLPFTDKLVETYLDEAPLLHAPPTYVLNEKMRKHVFASIEKYVLKSTDPNSAGGKGVFIGKQLKSDPKAFKKLQRKIAQDPLAYIAQEYIAPKEIDGRMFDFRPIVLATPQGFITSDLPVSRSAPSSAGKANYSTGQSKYAPVLVKKRSCQEFLAALPKAS